MAMGKRTEKAAATDTEAKAVDTTITSNGADYLIQHSKETKLLPLKCQEFFGSEILDLSQLDGAMRKDNQPAETSLNGSKLNFKLCQPSFKMDDAWTKSHSQGNCGSLEEKHQFYRSKGNDCQNTFEEPTITPIVLKTPNADDQYVNQGFQLTWSAGADAKPEDIVNLRVICDDPKGTNKEGKKEDKSATFWQNKVDALPNTMTYTGPEGCMLFDLSVVTGPIIKFMGFIQLIFGAVLCFVGRKWIHYSFAALAFMVTTGFVFSMAMNMNLIPGLSEGKKGGLIGVLCLSVIMGGIGATLFYKFAKAWATIIAGSICGALIVGVLLANTPLDSTAKTVAIMVGFFASGFAVTKVGAGFIEVAITAIIGSIMFFMGVGSFDPNFPKLTAENVKSQGEAGNPIFYGYMAGMVLLAGAGWFVQLKYTAAAYDDNYDKDDMMHPDNM